VADSPSIRTRFVATFAASVVRTALSFAASVVLARGLGVEQYGEFAFLVASVAALRQVLDLGTSNAFFTFMSQRPRGPRFVGFYVGWQVLQLAVAVLIVGALLPSRWIEVLWQRNPRELVALALIATFMQQQAFATLMQLGDAARTTIRAQLLNVGVAAVQLGVTLVLLALDALTLRSIFVLIAAQYLAAFVAGFAWIWRPAPQEDPVSGRTLIAEYARYSAPFVPYLVLGFLYHFGDSWMLRHFGGAQDTAYYGIANQISMAGLLVTNAIYTVLWKEIAEASHRGDFAKVQSLYTRTVRFVLLVGAAVCGAFIPWSAEILRILLGEQYVPGAPVLALLLVYPVYSGVGQIGGALLLATGRTKLHTLIGGLSMVVGIPATYLALASPDLAVPGFGLGALGLALKMVLLTVVTVNLLLWRIARAFGWPYHWADQIVILGIAIGLGWAARGLAALGIGSGLPPLPCAAAALLAYAAALGLAVWKLPSLAGLSRSDLNGMIAALRGRRIA